MRVLTAMVCVLVLSSPAVGSYIITPLSGGSSTATVFLGDTISLDVALTSDASDEHTSAIYRVVFSAAGLSYDSYLWAAPYTDGTDDDDSKPPATHLPALLHAVTLSGQGYPDGVIDVELSNVTDGSEFPPSKFGTGVVTTLMLRVPPDYPAPSTIMITVEHDTLADGFVVVPTTDGTPFELTILPEPTTLALLGTAVLSALMMRRRTAEGVHT